MKETQRVVELAQGHMRIRKEASAEQGEALLAPTTALADGQADVELSAEHTSGSEGAEASSIQNSPSTRGMPGAREEEKPTSPLGEATNEADVRACPGGDESDGDLHTASGSPWYDGCSKHVD